MRPLRQAARRVHILLISILGVSLAVTFTTCSVPNLETPQCVAARDTVKRFYSFYFADDMNSIDSARKRSTFLTNELSSQLAGPKKGEIDYFTATNNFPKAFRVGGCTSDSNDTATLEVVLLWRDDSSSDQKEVKVEVVQRFDRWLINKVSG
jgi:hypothetical protein